MIDLLLLLLDLDVGSFAEVDEDLLPPGGPAAAFATLLPPDFDDERVARAVLLMIPMIDGRIRKEFAEEDAKRSALSPLWTWIAMIL